MVVCLCVCFGIDLSMRIPDLNLDSDLNTCVGDRNLTKHYFVGEKNKSHFSRYSTSLLRCYKAPGRVLTKLHDEEQDSWNNRKKGG